MSPSFNQLINNSLIIIGPHKKKQKICHPSHSPTPHPPPLHSPGPTPSLPTSYIFEICMQTKMTMKNEGGWGHKPCQDVVRHAPVAVLLISLVTVVLLMLVVVLFIGCTHYCAHRFARTWREFSSPYQFQFKLILMVIVLLILMVTVLLIFACCVVVY